MPGYTPLFSSLTTGTLCGRWPDIGLWPIVLSLADKHGVVDVTPQFISGVTGLPVADVAACMARFLEPDQYSRSNAENGARLVLLDEHRDWGWKVVNHGQYREKARLVAKNAREVESGRAAERKAHVRRCPPLSAAVRRCPTPPNANANTNKDEEKNKKGAEAPIVLHNEGETRIVERLHASLPLDAWEEWLAHRRERRLSMSPRALAKQLKLLARFETETQREMIDTSINSGWQGLFALKGSTPREHKTKFQLAKEALERAAGD